jgi:DNA-binding Xre family transcriptional regulator
VLNYSVLDNIIEKKKFLKVDVAKASGLSWDGFLKMMKHKTMKVETLERIAEFLDVPVAVFFEGEKKQYKHNNNYSVVNETNANEMIEKLIKSLINENVELKLENDKLRSELTGYKKKYNQTG